MTDRELMQQAIEAMEYADACLKKQLTTKTKHEYAQDLLFEAGTALRERLAQPNEFEPDWDAMGVMVEEQQRMATEIDNLKWRLKTVNSAAMNLTHDLVCMDYDDDERLDRDRVMERIMQWRNEWDKAMHNNQPQMQPCAGRNCGSTNPNLHSAECFEDYEKATGMNQRKTLMDDFWEWLPKAYGEVGDEPAFTKYNMEVAYAAGAEAEAKRMWQGLSDEEKAELDAKYGDDMLAHLDAVEAKLKEKNG